jgi:23S rRNA pseudouridine1911/1915/1917 synthase
MQPIIITEENAKQRLDKFLTEVLSDFSRSQIQKKVKSGLIKVNKKETTVHHKLKVGDRIEFFTAEPREIDTEIFSNIKIIAETDEYLVIDKPAGILTHTDGSDTPSLTEWIIKNYPVVQDIYDKKDKDGVKRPGIVHRIDRDVSGLLVIAKTEDSFLNLKRQFKERVVNKNYIALVHGVIEPDSGKIERPIERGKDGKLVARGGTEESGRFALTEFTVLQRFQKFTLVSVKIHTGRTHQIRVHFASIGHSVVGDKLYQTKDIKQPSKLKRIFLFSNEIIFHNLSGKEQKFSIPISDELQNFLDNIK